MIKFVLWFNMVIFAPFMVLGAWMLMVPMFDPLWLYVALSLVVPIAVMIFCLNRLFDTAIQG